MRKNLPLFPLSLVVYPKEDLNLHIFEPRYKQLIKDCQENKHNFGIPTYIDNKVADYGTEVEIINVEKIYEDQRMDIKTRGVQVFKILNFSNPFEDRLYAGGAIETQTLGTEIDQEIQQGLLKKLDELYDILQITVNLDYSDVQFLSYEVAHKIGLSIEQEYELLCINEEKDRQAYLLEHLEKAIPIISEMEKTKQLIRMNGHFKYFDPLNF